MQGVIILASRYQNQWRTEYSSPQGCSHPPTRDNIARALNRLEAFQEADSILGPGAGSSPAKRKLIGAMSLAVLVETLASNKIDEAIAFWSSVATYGDGIAGELRDTLLEGKAPSKAGTHFIPRLVGAAWNQRGAGSIRREHKRGLVVQGTTLEIPA